MSHDSASQNINRPDVTFVDLEQGNDINLLQEVADSYFIQEKEEDFRAKGKLKLEYYFDSFDVINMVQGAMAYDNGLRFDSNAYKKEESKNFVYALAFHGLFGKIRMLPPHQLEFVNKLDKVDVFFKAPKNRNEFLELCQEVLFNLGFNGKGTPPRLNFPDIDKQIQQLIEQGTDLFRANYLLREATWAGRLKYLINEKILVLDDNVQGAVDIQNVERFYLIKDVFDKIRPDYPTNNHYDALALYHLQKKLDQYKNDPAKNVLPVLYNSSFRIKEAVSMLQEINPELFTYRLGSKPIPILRDSLFFVLEAVFTIGDSTEGFFKDLQDSKEEIKALVGKQYEAYYKSESGLVKDWDHVRKQFEEKVRDIIDVKFVQEIWIKHRAYQQLVDQLKEIYTLEEDQLPTVDAKVRAALNEVLRTAKINLMQSQKMSAIIEGFQNIDDDITNYLGSLPGRDIFQEFALMKFGLDRRKLPNLQKRIIALVTHEEEQAGTPPAIRTVMNSLSIRPDNEEKAKQFLSALTVAWLLNKLDLINTLCSDFKKKDLKKRYETALIYGAAHIARKRNRQGITRTKEIIECVLSQLNENYKVWLGVGYLYFQLWTSMTTLKPDLPEMHEEAWNNQRKSKDYKEYVLNGAIKYANLAYDFLRDKKPEDSLRLQNYLYALNNVIYYTTKCGSRKEYAKLAPLVRELEGYEDYSEWQGRFYDTLGWYYLRRCLLSEDESLRKSYLNESEVNYDAATRLGAPDRELTLYRQLNRAIMWAKENIFEKGK